MQLILKILKNHELYQKLSKAKQSLIPDKNG